MYAEPTDESSQDSQIIGTIYPMDNCPIPDAKLEKIVGMSEPSAYRLSTTNYIDAKKRGEIPPPPKHTLGTKLKQTVNQNLTSNPLRTRERVRPLKTMNSLYSNSWIKWKRPHPSL